MPGIGSQQLKPLSGCHLNRLWKLPEALPKAVCCSVHLEFLQLSCGLLIEGFFDQEIQFSRF